MSKLVKRLQQVCECSSPPMGFKKDAVQAAPQMLLVASLPRGKRGLVTGLNLAEVDGLLLHGRDLGDSTVLQQVSGSAGDKPWGAWLGEGQAPELPQFVEAGGDFIALESPLAPAGLLQEDVGKILKVDLTRQRFLLGAISDLPVDAVLMELGEGRGPLTIADMMHCQWLSGLLDKPLLVGPRQELSDNELRLMCDIGVAAIVVEVSDEKGKELLSRTFQLIRDLPPRTRKRGEDHVLLPSLEVEPDED